MVHVDGIPVRARLDNRGSEAHGDTEVVHARLGKLCSHVHVDAKPVRARLDREELEVHGDTKVVHARPCRFTSTVYRYVLDLMGKAPRFRATQKWSMLDLVN